MTNISRRWPWVLLLIVIVALAVGMEYEKAHPPASALTPAERAAFEVKAAAALEMIRLRGYECRTIDTIMPEYFPEGWTIRCNHGDTFHLVNHGGKWSLKVD
jgi:hypothetical protein